MEFADTVEKFIFMHDMPEPSDIIFIPGNGYPQMAEKAAELYRNQYAPYILPSGKYSISDGTFAGVLDKRDTYSGTYATEWAFLRDVLIQNGVPQDAILKEDQATFTWENARESRKITDQNHLSIRKAILCCKNYHARRAYMYYRTAFPEAKILVCPSCVDGITETNWRKSEAGIDSVMAETTRIIRQFSLMM